MIDITYEEAISYWKGEFLLNYTDISEESPCVWTKHNLIVVGDGYIPECGTRIHIVKEKLYKSPMMIDNAVVFTLQTGE